MNPEHVVIQIAAMAWAQQVPLSRTFRARVRSGGGGAVAPKLPKEKIKAPITIPFEYKKNEEP